MNTGPSTHRSPIILITHALLLILICSQASGGSKWKNPSEKYLHAHEQFLGAGCPLQNDEMKHFVYFARDREAMYDHPFLKISRFTGAQIMYSWRQIEPSENHYDFSIILKDLDYLKSHGKKLFLQLQDATFDPQRLAVPDYLLTREYDDGAIYQRDDNGKPEGWVAKRWNPRVQRRFALLLEAMGRVLDGKIEGINLQETAIGLTQKYDPTFSPELYVAAVKTNMLALKRAFPESITMQYANFMPGEWLPWDDFGYLRSVYQYGEKIQVSLGAPDLMVRTKGQLNHALAMMHEGKYTVPLGIAVQDGNYIGKTATDQVLRKRDNLVPLLHAFARDFLRVKLMFWSYQEPYFHEDVMPCFETGKLR